MDNSSTKYLQDEPDRARAQRAASPLRRHLENDPALAARFSKIRQFARPIVTTNYDISRECNLFCEGCFFFEGPDFLPYEDDKSDAAWDLFFRAEAARGVNYGYFAGAEPALRQARLRSAARHIQRGSINTNGTIRIPEEIPYMLHISLWGNAESSLKLRGARAFEKALDNFAEDPRAIFVLTVNSLNLDEVHEVTRICADRGARITYNHFSPTNSYVEKLAAHAENDDSYFRFSSDDENLAFNENSLARATDILGEMLDRYPRNVIYSHHYNELVGDPRGLYSIDPATGVALDCGNRKSPYHRHYNVDQSPSTGKCCAPNLACGTCRAYIMSYASILNRMREFLGSADSFRKWVDVSDTWCRLFIRGWDEIDPTVDKPAAALPMAV